MIHAKFKKSDSLITSFVVSGHSMSAPYGEDVICAFVSSACLMTANTITEVIGLTADTSAKDGYLSVEIKDEPNSAQDILNGLVLHLTELSKDYPDNIKITISEV